MKKFLTAFLAMALAVTCFAACNKEDDGSGDSSSYNGILTQIKLGMPLTKIISTNQKYNVNLNYETDTVIWSQNPDTELMELRDLIPAESAYYYVDDSFITYYFETRKGDDEIYLNGYMSEVYCLLDRDTAKKYFDEKTAELEKRHGVKPAGTQKGTEDIDLEIDYIQRYNCPSYDLTFTRTDKYDTVDGVTGYYGSHFSIEVKAKVNKEETPIGGTTAAEKD